MKIDSLLHENSESFCADPTTMKYKASLALAIAAAVLCGLAGCSIARRTEFNEQERRRMLGVILPNSVQVVSAFTRPASFDDDATLDGIEVVLQTLDAQGEPTKLSGRLVFEMYTYKKASADPKGRLAQTWTHTLTSEKDQESYWDRASRMYRFQLLVNKNELPIDNRYVVLARYTNPWNEHFEDEAVIDLTPFIRQIKHELRTATGQ